MSRTPDSSDPNPYAPPASDLTPPGVSVHTNAIYPAAFSVLRYAVILIGARLLAGALTSILTSVMGMNSQSADKETLVWYVLLSLAMDILGNMIAIPILLIQSTAALRGDQGGRTITPGGALRMSLVTAAVVLATMIGDNLCVFPGVVMRALAFILLDLPALAEGRSALIRSDREILRRAGLMVPWIVLSTVADIATGVVEVLMNAQPVPLSLAASIPGDLIVAFGWLVYVAMCVTLRPQQPASEAERPR